ncbi:MAG: glycosyltransferase family 9 protein [Nitrospirae bacterium]|nr:glycosyltransferase family 9 protein [Nitrospirota bacterium]
MNLYNAFVMELLRLVFLGVRLLDRRPPPSKDIRSARSVIVFSTTAIGDTLMNTPAIRALRKALPGARLTAVADRRRADLLRHNPHIDALVIYPGKFRKLFSLFKKLRAARPDWAVVLHGNDPDIPILAYLSGAPGRAGWRESRMSFLFTHAPTIDRDLPFVRRRLDLLAELGVPEEGERTEITIPPDAREAAARRLAAAGVDGAEEIVAFHPFGSRRSKWWPEGNGRTFVQRLTRETGRRTVVLGGEKEKASAEAFFGRMDERPVVLCGEMGLLETGALLLRCAALVTTDSGPMHLGFALDVPTVALFGPEDFRHYGVGHREGKAVFRMGEAPCERPCKKKDCDVEGHPCMASIAAGPVLDAMQSLLARPTPV